MKIGDMEGKWRLKQMKAPDLRKRAMELKELNELKEELFAALSTCY